MIDIRTWEGEGGSSGLIVEGFVDTLIEEGEGEGEARGSIRSVGDEPQTPEGEGETGGSIGQRPNIWEEMFGWVSKWRYSFSAYQGAHLWLSYEARREARA